MQKVPISSLFSLEKGSLQSLKNIPGDYDFVTAGSERKTHETYSHDCEALIFAMAASGSLGRTHYVSGKFIASDLCFIMVPKKEKTIYMPFYHLYFNSIRENVVKHTATGSAKLAINQTNFGNYEINFYDYDSQKELYEKFKTINPGMESMFNLMQDSNDFLKSLRQSILSDAIAGKLVPQDPTDEPASVLLSKIQAEKAQLIADKKIKAPKPLAPITEDEKPFDLPQGWEWVRLNEISEVGTGATPLKNNSDYYGGNIPWITSSSTGLEFVTEANDFITEKAVLETNCKVYPIGTLLIAMYGQGKTRGQITELGIEAATNQACASVSLYYKNNELKEFIKIYFKNIYLEIRDLAEGGAQPNLNLSKIANTLIPLPPLTEQHRIVTKVEQLMNLCDQLEAQISDTQSQGKLLMEAVMQQAMG